jgi:hypothetical protein
MALARRSTFSSSGGLKASIHCEVEMKYSRALDSSTSLMRTGKTV